MAKNNFSLDFQGFLDLAHDIDSLGDGYLQKAVTNAFTASKDYVNNEVSKAMDSSRYNFEAGQGYSKGKAKTSLNKIAQMPVEWDGTVVKAYIGVDLSEAPEAIILAYGTKKGNPHLQGDTKLLNALKVKGNIKKEVERIQLEEFNKVMEEALNNG